MAIPGDDRSTLSTWGYAGIGDPASAGGCCSSRYDDSAIRSKQRFTFEYAVSSNGGDGSSHGAGDEMATVTEPLVELPWFEYAASADTSAQIWEDNCNGVPLGTEYMVLTAGTVKDYFKPLDGKDYCEMLTTHNFHLWSNDGVHWHIPAYNTNTAVGGGSARDWPKNNIAGDARAYLSFWRPPAWANSNTVVGGCCASSTTVYYDKDANTNTFPVSRTTFKLSFMIRRVVARPMKETLLLNVTGNDDVYGNDMFKKLDNAMAAAFTAQEHNPEYVIVRMGAVKDFFKLDPDHDGGKHSYQTMFSARDEHLWSPDGLYWYRPVQSNLHTGPSS